MPTPNEASVYCCLTLRAYLLSKHSSCQATPNLVSHRCGTPSQDMQKARLSSGSKAGASTPTSHLACISGETMGFTHSLLLSLTW